MTHLLINDRNKIISVINNLNSLVFDSAFLFCDYFFNELGGYSITDFDDIRYEIDSKKMNDVYAHFVAGFALSPIDEDMLYDIIILAQHRSPNPEKGSLATLQSLARLSAQRVYYYVRSIRLDNRITDNVTSSVEFLAKIAAMKAGLKISLPKSLSRLIGEPLSNLMFNKTKFDMNFSEEDTVVLEVNLLGLFAMENMYENRYFKSSSHMKASFIDTLEDF